MTRPQSQTLLFSAVPQSRRLDYGFGSQPRIHPITDAVRGPNRRRLEASRATGRNNHFGRLADLPDDAQETDFRLQRVEPALGICGGAQPIRIGCRAAGPSAATPTP
jgi:hypothetical protein